MKKLFISLLIFTLFIFQPSSAFAAIIHRDGEYVRLEQNEVVDGTFFATGDQIIISGTVNGDAYVAGGDILIDGTINGDLLIAGGNLEIRGNVSDDVRAAGGNINVAGVINKNLTVFGGSVDISDSATVSGSLVSGGGKISQFGVIGSDVTVGAGQLTLGDRVGGDVMAGVGDLTLTSGASIGGNLTYWSDQILRENSGSQVEGNIIHHQTNMNNGRSSKSAAEAFAGFAILWTIYSFIVSLILGALFIKIVPVFSKNFTTVALTRPGMSFLVGLITVLVTPIFIVLLMITILGIPVALIIGALYLILLYVAKIFTAMFVGRKLLEWIKVDFGMYRSLILGLIILLVLNYIPVIGWIVGFGLFLIGVGALLIQKQHVYQELRGKKI